MLFIINQTTAVIKAGGPITVLATQKVNEVGMRAIQ
jgi:hypothetical protein